ncbi:hypothetical protein CgunFtcFv8_001555 [Champsocephalus gunnari]|uniref:AIG1-type G domain-containing protein n=1 Tax=Champsocephalus gunnari TaxID=52237 RepID=A0AAN8CNL9_CHAGU|nr:hypothetical protein CgunFtcFv8_001555 [Champsocephalus gunnari]
MECQCEKDNPEDAAGGWWNMQMGTFTVVGYLLYRFSQTLPALIRWPIRIFCSLTGVSALWSWVSHLVGTLRGIQGLCKWLSRIWRFIGSSSSKFKWLIAVILGSEMEPGSSGACKPGLRLIILGPTWGGRTSLADVLLGKSKKHAPEGPLMESTRRSTVMDSREVVVVETPDVLGTSLVPEIRAREALRSLQLCGPGPHAFLLVVQASGSKPGVDHDIIHAILTTINTFGAETAGFIIPVLIQPDHRDELPNPDYNDMAVRKFLRLRIEENTIPKELKKIRRQVMELVMEVKSQKEGHFVHELQKREESIREELLHDMTSALAEKLPHVY